MARATRQTSDRRLHHVTDDRADALGAVHADAVQLASALQFMDAQFEALYGDGPDAAEARGGYASLITMLATTSQALADRIEGLERAIGRGREGAS